MSIAEHLTQLHDSILRLKSFIPKATTEETSIPNMLPLAINQNIYGNVEQDGEPTPDTPVEVETLKGWNLFNINSEFYVRDTKTNYEVDGSDLKVINTNATGNGGIWINIPVKTNEKITIKYDEMTEESVVSSNRVEYLFTDEPITSYTAGTTLSKTNKKVILTSDKKYLLILLRIGNGNGYTIKGLQVYHGEDDKPYLPYNSIGIKRTGKNLNPNKGLKYISSTSKMFYLPKGTYTFNLDTKNAFGIGNNIYFKIYDKSKKQIQETGHISGFSFSTSSFNYYKSVSENDNKVTFTSDNDYYYTIGFNNNIPTTGNELMLSSGTTIQDYEPYQEKITYIDLQGNEALPDDEIKIDEKGNVKLIKNWGKVVLDGSEDWEKYSGSKRFYMTLNGSAKPETNTSKANMVSNFFTTYSASYSNENVNVDAISLDTAKRLLVRLVSYNNKTLEEFKTWLSENKPIVYYQLAEPIEIDLGKARIIPLEGTNNIEVLATLEPSKIETTYYVDAKKYIEDMTTTLLEFGGEE